MKFVLLTFIFVAIFGWIMNLIDVIQVIIANPAFSELNVLIIAKALGVFFFPVGAILGYF
jgi:hypothetical protein